jgi:hypothetical protein
MKVQFSNLKDLFQGILAGEVVFDDEQSARDCINTIAGKCAADAEVTLESFWGYGEADDITEALNEIFFNEGYDVDWFDLLSFNFDIDDLAVYLMSVDKLSLHYSHEELMNFVESTMTSWSNNAENFCIKTLDVFGSSKL